MSDTTVNIRGAMPDDAEAIARIYVESWNAGFQQLMHTRSVDAELIERWRATLSAPPPKRWWTASLSGTTCGFVGIGPSRDLVDSALGEVDTIAVHSNYWRQGIGRALMSTALTALSSDGYQEAILWTLENYELGQAFYASTGWERDGGKRDSGKQIRYRHALS